jgi:hypothetical protein
VNSTLTERSALARVKFPSANHRHPARINLLATAAKLRQSIIALACECRQYHAVNIAGRRGPRSVEVTVRIQPDQAHLPLCGDARH